MRSLDAFVNRIVIAYFSMEIALRPEMHTYSGGLGVLAGDTARSGDRCGRPHPGTPRGHGAGCRPGSHIPVVFTVVADPFGTRLAESFEASGRVNVTGTFNRVPETVNVEVVRRYDPTFQKLGLLYNSDEANSLLKLEELRSLADEMSFELVALELDPGSDQEPTLRLMQVAETVGN